MIIDEKVVTGTTFSLTVGTDLVSIGANLIFPPPCGEG